LVVIGQIKSYINLNYTYLINSRNEQINLANMQGGQSR